MRTSLPVHLLLYKKFLWTALSFLFFYSGHRIKAMSPRSGMVSFVRSWMLLYFFFFLVVWSMVGANTRPLQSIPTSSFASSSAVISLPHHYVENPARNDLPSSWNYCWYLWTLAFRALPICTVVTFLWTCLFLSSAWLSLHCIYP